MVAQFRNNCKDDFLHFEPCQTCDNLRIINLWFYGIFSVFWGDLTNFPNDTRVK